MDLLQALQEIPEFQKVPVAQLQWMTEKGKVHVYYNGDKFFMKGDNVMDSSV